MLTDFSGSIYLKVRQKFGQISEIIATNIATCWQFFDKMRKKFNVKIRDENTVGELRLFPPGPAASLRFDCFFAGSFKLYAESGQILQGSFSAVSKPNFASKYSLESSRRDLHNALLCTALESQNFR